jgi:hypothetical protein
MKKKIILLALCGVLLLIFTSSSYGGFDPKYKEREQADPWQHQISPEVEDDQDLEIALLAISPEFCLVFIFHCKIQNFRSPGELAKQSLDSSVEHDTLNKNDAKFRK